jgi:hypothetical protein
MHSREGDLRYRLLGRERESLLATVFLNQDQAFVVGRPKLLIRVQQLDSVN